MFRILKIKFELSLGLKVRPRVSVQQSFRIYSGADGEEREGDGKRFCRLSQAVTSDYSEIFHCSPQEGAAPMRLLTEKRIGAVTQKGSNDAVKEKMMLSFRIGSEFITYAEVLLKQ
ncbi:hypothetical protein AVEN_178823-1 [Araneus ventricosus]|uniref:Uncharacterized protein n=1 Tax=Araneus ventricosus TaxID=182803 RepID=A0A4Y2BEI8_ARAVE|nr:hypothetical protein AVEN_178823-1 [Araneus ventricosus]